MQDSWRFLCNFFTSFFHLRNLSQLEVIAGIEEEIEVIVQVIPINLG